GTRKRLGVGPHAERSVFAGMHPSALVPFVPSCSDRLEETRKRLGPSPACDAGKNVGDSEDGSRRDPCVRSRNGSPVLLARSPRATLLRLFPAAILNDSPVASVSIADPAPRRKQPGRSAPATSFEREEGRFDRSMSFVRRSNPFSRRVRVVKARVSSSAVEGTIPGTRTPQEPTEIRLKIARPALPCDGGTEGEDPPFAEEEDRRAVFVPETRFRLPHLRRDAVETKDLFSRRAGNPMPKPAFDLRTDRTICEAFEGKRRGGSFSFGETKSERNSPSYDDSRSSCMHYHWVDRARVCEEFS
ncbi:unnamed protein product, partial [Darwinula stevensoni]